MIGHQGCPFGAHYPEDFGVLLACRHRRPSGLPRALPKGRTAGSGWGLLSILMPHRTVLSHSGSRGWSAGLAKCSCRTAPPDLRPLRLETHCAVGAATCRGFSIGSMPACASRNFSASFVVSSIPYPCRFHFQSGSLPSDFAMSSPHMVELPGLCLELW